MRYEPPGYLAAVLTHVAHASIAPGSVVNVEVRHEAACALLTNTGECDCEPTVLSGEAIERKYHER